MIPAGLIGWAAEALIASTILMVLVLMIRRPARRAFGPGIAYALWLLPATRLLLPPLPAAWRDSVAAPIAQANERFTVLIVEPLGLTRAAETAQTGPSLVSIAIALWALGAAAFIAWHLWSHDRFCRRMLASAAVVTDGRVRVISSAVASGPLAFGIWRKYVAFPSDFDDRYDADERALALAHELTHHARGDLVANWVALLVLALHWFNPIAWRAFRAFRADQEMACDAGVIADQGRESAHAYGRAIVKSAHGRAVSAACHMHTVSDLKGRLRMLSSDRRSRLRLIGGTAGVVVAVIAGLTVTASGTQAAETLRGSVGTAIGVDLTQAPSPPPAPAAEAPEVAEAPEAPEAPEAMPREPRVVVVKQRKDRAPVVVIDGSGKEIRTVSRVIRIKDGKVLTEDVAGVAPVVVPEISDRQCADSDGEPEQLVLNDSKNGRKVIILCTNRIERMTKKAAEIAANSADIQRNAYRSALDGLRGARAQTAGDKTMAADARKQALWAIDTAIAELEGDVAKVH